MTINSLVLAVYGKVDKTWVILRLFSDNKYPELCPNRPFLVYLYLLGWEGGNIFPTANARVYWVFPLIARAKHDVKFRECHDSG